MRFPSLLPPTRPTLRLPCVKRYIRVRFLILRAKYLIRVSNVYRIHQPTRFLATSMILGSFLSLCLRNFLHPPSSLFLTRQFVTIFIIEICQVLSGACRCSLNYPNCQISPLSLVTRKPKYVPSIDIAFSVSSYSTMSCNFARRPKTTQTFPLSLFATRFTLATVLPKFSAPTHFSLHNVIFLAQSHSDRVEMIPFRPDTCVSNCMACDPDHENEISDRKPDISD